MITISAVQFYVAPFFFILFGMLISVGILKFLGMKKVIKLMQKLGEDAPECCK